MIKSRTLSGTGLRSREEGMHRSVAAAIGLHLDLLDKERRARFGELGVFPFPDNLTGRIDGANARFPHSNSWSFRHS